MNCVFRPWLVPARNAANLENEVIPGAAVTKKSGAPAYLAGMHRK